MYPKLKLILDMGNLNMSGINMDSGSVTHNWTNQLGSGLIGIKWYNFGIKDVLDLLFKPFRKWLPQHHTIGIGNPYMNLKFQGKLNIPWVIMYLTINC